MEELVVALAPVLVQQDGVVLDVRQLFVHQHVQMVEHAQVLALVHAPVVGVELDVLLVG